MSYVVSLYTDLAKGTFNMLSIQDPELSQLNYDHQQEPKSLKHLAQHPALDLPFRSYFLLAVICSLVAIALWSSYLNGYFTFVNKGISPLAWHIHEMIFGFCATVAVGFILTAAQTWTGKPSIKGLPLLAFIMLWLGVRVVLLVNHPNAALVAIALQSIWWLGSIAIFTRLVLSSHNRRNYLFIPLLLGLMLLNIAFLLVDYLGLFELTRHMARTCVLMFCLLMTILGGRVIPFFTVSGAKTEPINTPNWLTPLLTATSILSVLVFFSSAFFKLPISPAVFMITAGVLHLIRQSYWHSKATKNITLLWSLHLSYFSLALGLIFLGMSYLPLHELNLSLSLAFGDALHLITIAAMALMIFAMMSRVSLGHTGRPLIPSKLVPWIFYFIIISALARTFLPMFHLPLLAWNISSLTWLLAGIIFLVIYLPILIAKKVEKPLVRRV
jgi:uncharacterized protein involved in response to NO